MKYEGVQAQDTGWSRVLPCEAIINFRDFGGYATAAGGRVVTGRLFRAAHQHEATDADLALMARLNLALVVDLRRPTERRTQPSRRPPNWRGQVIENDIGDEAETPHLTFLRRTDVTPAAIEEYLQGYYRKALHEERHMDLFARALKALPQTDGAALVHCAAGKDRTGLLVALVHTVLGVHRDDIIADYLLTNELTMTGARRAEVQKRLSGALGRPVPDEAVHAFLGVAGHHLEIAFDSAKERYGSVDGYLTRLGVTSADRDAIIARYTA
ncbi:tyrosine-protein phosphatase [Camelimonas abortus]|uniref:Tyrosine-protein phosphatase n=1 Tax=Camelimonas abortus TaxID=1017184 RepID=A0ABV7LEZ7_9HYPH